MPARRDIPPAVGPLPDPGGSDGSGGPAAKAQPPDGGGANPAPAPVPARAHDGGDGARTRRRVPVPLLKQRVPSGRGAIEQPNASGDGDAALTIRFWVALLLTGIATGLFGAGLMWLLFHVEHLAFNYSSGPLESAVERASDLRRLVSLLVAGLVGGMGWFLLRRFTEGEKSDADDSIWRGDARLSFRRCLGTSVLSEVVVGMGASIGREQAPKLMGAASGSVISGRLRLTKGQRRLVVACGAGAGLAAVYNVPLGGALFTIEVLLGSTVLPAVLPALACSFIATLTAWAYLPSAPTYVGVPAYHFTASLMVWACAAGPVIGLVAIGYVRLIGWVSYHGSQGVRLIPSMVVAFGALGLIGFEYPQLFGNGKDMAHDAFVGSGTLVTLLALSALKPLVTAACLKSGAAGGLFTPTLSTGAVLGGLFGLLWVHLWPGEPVGAYAMVGAAAMIGAAMQAPLAGLALVLELTHSGYSMLVPMIAATVLATGVVRYADGYSIYSARLPARPTRSLAAS
ncbi:MAG TPA: chloride channel protein [Acidimicrobiales bacterium]|nr:chloride channel protein [Acidimicrobiales bacterium]